jgi:hypothetical protein
LNKRLGEPQIQSGCHGEEKNVAHAVPETISDRKQKGQNLFIALSHYTKLNMGSVLV